MGFGMKANAVNQIPKGTEIFLENEPAAYVCVVIRGRVSATGEAVKLSFGPGSFIGVYDLFVGHYISGYVTEEDTMLYAFPATDRLSLVSVLENNNKDYRGLMVNSLTKCFYELSHINQQFHTTAGELYTLLSESYEKYKGFCRDAGEGVVTLPALEQIEEYQEEDAMDRSRFPYYEDLAKVPADIQKSFFACGTTISMVHITEISGLIAALMVDTRYLCDYLMEHFSCLYNEGSQNLLSLSIRLASEIGKKGRPVAGLQGLVDKLLDEFNRMEKLLTRYMSDPPGINRERLEKMYTAMLTNEELEESEETVSEDDVYRSLKGSMQQIIDYSGATKEQMAAFVDYINQFVLSKDRMTAEDSGRLLRRKIAEGFYPLYRLVFLRSLKEKGELPKAVELFLNFGYLDERLLTKAQIVELCRLKMTSGNSYHCTIFTIPEWLYAVYTGKRQPSKNEFDLEYVEMLREQRKTGEITAEDEKKYAADPLRRLDYEISNMFRCNHRVVNGQPSTFVPVLCSEQMLSAPGRALVTKDRMGQMIEKYREIDYSVFYRELGYADEELKIEKEQIMQEIIPDVILFPACGQNAAMWQEMSCKRRDSGGRFLFPILLEGSLDDLVVRTFGRYRWEICRTMQGSSWNNIQVKSLTSEYSDYIQFYRKNKDLSEERKEKVKQQIAKGKNNYREIFVQDYELWIKSEAMGGIRLNKVAREILAMYCPFNKEIRNALETQPAFADALGRFKRETVKKTREIELRYHALMTKQKIELTPPMVETLKFYKEK